MWFAHQEYVLTAEMSDSEKQRRYDLLQIESDDELDEQTAVTESKSNHRRKKE